MKKTISVKKLILIIALLIILSVLIFLYFLLKPIKAPTTNKISKIINLELKDSRKKVLYGLSNDYTLFKSDRYTCVYDCKKNLNLENKKGWRKLPFIDKVDEDIEIYSLFKDNKYKELLPKISNGYYYYNNKSKDPYNYKKSRGEYLNCYIAVYDKDTGKLYFTDATNL